MSQLRVPSAEALNSASLPQPSAPLEFPDGLLTPRRYWAVLTIGLGIVMLTQPFSLDLYSYSFVAILSGTIGFVIVSHFPQ